VSAAKSPSQVLLVLLLERGKVQCLLQFFAALGKCQQVEETDYHVIRLAIPLVDKALNLNRHSIKFLVVRSVGIVICPADNR